MAGFFPLAHSLKQKPPATSYFPVFDTSQLFAIDSIDRSDDVALRSINASTIETIDLESFKDGDFDVRRREISLHQTITADWESIVEK